MVLPEPKSGLSTSEPRHYPQISRPEIQDTRCLDPDSGSAPPTATPCPIPKTPNDGLSEMNLSSGTPISGPGPSTHDRDLRSQSHISRPGTRSPGSASLTRLNEPRPPRHRRPELGSPSPQETGSPAPRPRPSDSGLAPRFVPAPVPDPGPHTRPAPGFMERAQLGGSGLWSVPDYTSPLLSHVERNACAATYGV